MHTEVTFDDGFAEATRKAYGSDWRVFTAWCTTTGTDPFRVTPEGIADYIDHLSLHRKPSTIARNLASLASIYRTRGLTDPALLKASKVGMRRVWRRAGRRQKQAKAVTSLRRDEMLDSTENDIRGLRNRALLCVAYDLGCRRSETASLHAQDIERSEEGDATILVRRSKTDQEGNGSVRYLSPTTVSAVDAWMDAARIESGPLFRSINKVGKVGSALTGGSISRIYKDMCKAAGHAPEEVALTSGHSTRVGMAQDMATAGIDLAGIMQAGNWKTPAMVARYIERLNARKGAAARLASIQGR